MEALKEQQSQLSISADKALSLLETAQGFSRDDSVRCVSSTACTGFLQQGSQA